MPRYASPEEFYAEVGAALRGASIDPELAPQLKRVDAVVQHRLSDPAAQITIDARESKDGGVQLGDTELVPDIVVSMSSDTAHALWSGDLRLVPALASGEIAVKGPVGGVLRHLALAAGVAARFEDLQAADTAPDEAPVEEPEASAEVGEGSAEPAPEEPEEPEAEASEPPEPEEQEAEASEPPEPEEQEPEAG